MASTFDLAFQQTIGLEGGFSNDPADAGGATKYGITATVALAHGYRGDMRDLTLEQAKRIARDQYWDTLRLDDVAVMSRDVARELFDTGYNCGISTAGKFLQRALNAFNHEGADYPDVEADGVVGPMTIAAFERYMEKRGIEGERVFLRALNGLQCAYYIGICEAKASQERFVYGWINNRVS